MKILKIFKKPVFLITLVVLAAVLSVSVVAAENATYGKVTSYEVGMQGSVYLKLNVSVGSMTGTDYFEVAVTDRDAVETYTVDQITEGKILVKLAPTEMNKTVTVTPVMGETRGTAQTFSVKEYADAVLAEPTYATKFHDPMRTLLNWGAKSEAFFGAGTSINIGEIFTRGTDPSTSVIKENITVPEKANKTETGVFKGGKHELSLILDEGNISLCFKFAASEKVSDAKVTITRRADKNTQDVNIATDQVVTYSGGYYTVKINGITTSLFDDVYTVAVSDGGTNSITAQASVLEYLYKILNNESVDATKPTEQKATAQALFQFYQATNNKFDTECTHGYQNFFWIHTGDASYSRCSACFKTLGNKVPDSAKIYSSLSDIVYYKGNNPTVSMCQYDATNDVLYNSYSNNGAIGITAVHLKDQTREPGRYMVIKYRMNTTGGNYLLLDQFGTTAAKSAVGRLDKSTEWKVAVIDLDTVEKWPKGSAANLYMYFTAVNQTDIAYVATFDKFADIAGLVEKDEAILYKATPTLTTAGAAAIMTTAKIDLNYLDCTKSGHDIAAKQVAVDGGTKYVYSCSKGDYNLYETTVPENINYYAGLESIKIGPSNNPTVTKYQYDEANGVLYHSVSIPGSATELNISSGDADLTSARYLVIKYRMSGGNIRLEHVKTTGGEDEKDQGFHEIFPTNGKWRVVVLDMGDKVKSDTNSKFAIAGTIAGGADIAYVAITDTLEEVKGLLTEKDYAGSDVMLRKVVGPNSQPTHVRSVAGGMAIDAVLDDKTYN